MPPTLRPSPSRQTPATTLRPLLKPADPALRLSSSLGRLPLTARRPQPLSGPNPQTPLPPAPRWSSDPLPQPPDSFPWPKSYPRSPYTLSPRRSAQPSDCHRSSSLPDSLGPLTCCSVAVPEPTPFLILMPLSKADPSRIAFFSQSAPLDSQPALSLLPPRGLVLHFLKPS